MSPPLPHSWPTSQDKAQTPHQGLPKLYHLPFAQLLEPPILISCHLLSHSGFCFTELLVVPLTHHAFSHPMPFSFPPIPRSSCTRHHMLPIRSSFQAVFSSHLCSPQWTLSSREREGTHLPPCFPVNSALNSCPDAQYIQ